MEIGPHLHNENDCGCSYFQRIIFIHSSKVKQTFLKKNSKAAMIDLKITLYGKNEFKLRRLQNQLRNLDNMQKKRRPTLNLE